MEIIQPVSICIAIVQFRRLKHNNILFFSQSSSKLPKQHSKQKIIILAQVSRELIDGETTSFSCRKIPFQNGLNHLEKSLCYIKCVWVYEIYGLPWKQSTIKVLLEYLATCYFSSVFRCPGLALGPRRHWLFVTSDKSSK